MKRNKKQCKQCGKYISLSNYSKHAHACKNKPIKQTRTHCI